MGEFVGVCTTASLAVATTLLAPALATLVLGTGYAFAQNLIWASLTLVAPPKLLNLCSGAHT